MDERPFYPDEPPRSLSDLNPQTFHQKELKRLDIQDIPYTQGNIETLKDWHKVFAEMKVMGYQNVKIAKELNVHEMTLAKVQRSPIFKVYLNDLRKQAEENSVFDVAAHLQRVTKKTFETMEALMDNAESETVRASMVREYADRISPKVNKTEHESTNTIFLESDTVKQLATNLIQSCNLTQDHLEGKTDEEIIDILESSVEGKPYGKESDQQENETT